MITNFEYETDDETWYRIYSGGEFIGNLRITHNHMAPWEAVETGIMHDSFYAPVAIMNRGVTKTEVSNGGVSC